MFARKFMLVALAVIFALAFASSGLAGHTPPEDPRGDPWDHTLGEGNDDPGSGAKVPATTSGGGIIIYWWVPGMGHYAQPLTITQLAPKPASAKATSPSRVNR